MHQSTDHFFVNGRTIDNLTLADCWTWAYSDLTDSMSRSVLAEFIIATALDVAGKAFRKPPQIRRPYNFLSKHGYRIAVDSASYTQSCDAEHPEQITFRNISAPLCDVCIFCVHKALSDKTSPLDLDTWDFYVLHSSVLSENRPELKTITLPSLLQLEPLWCDYHGIEEAVRETMNA